MSASAADHQSHEAHGLRCAACGTPHAPGDHFCAHCGAVLGDAISPPPSSSEKEAEERPAWVIGARPTAVIGGGIALLVLAVLLLAVGQIDDTGTIVMLAICTAPLGLLTLVIGIARYFAGVAHRR